jgi:hypothetical protein
MKKTKELPEPKFNPKRDYVFDRAMVQAAKRARAAQPELICVVSNVKGFQNETNK